MYLNRGLLMLPQKDMKTARLRETVKGRDRDKNKDRGLGELILMTFPMQSEHGRRRCHGTR